MNHVARIHLHELVRSIANETRTRFQHQESECVRSNAKVPEDELAMFCAVDYGDRLDPAPVMWLLFSMDPLATEEYQSKPIPVPRSPCMRLTPSRRQMTTRICNHEFLHEGFLLG